MLPWYLTLFGAKMAAELQLLWSSTPTTALHAPSVSLYCVTIGSTTLHCPLALKCLALCIPYRKQ